VVSQFEFPLLIDAVEKVRGLLPADNNRILTRAFLNRGCPFGTRLESILLGKACKILFQQYQPEADQQTRHRSRCRRLHRAALLFQLQRESTRSMPVYRVLWQTSAEQTCSGSKWRPSPPPFLALR